MGPCTPKGLVNTWCSQLWHGLFHPPWKHGTACGMHTRWGLSAHCAPLRTLDCTVHPACALCTVHTVHTVHIVHTTSTLCALCTPHLPRSLQWAYLNNHLSVCDETKDRFNNHRYPIICAYLQKTRVIPYNVKAYRILIQGVIFGGPENQK